MATNVEEIFSIKYPFAYKVWKDCKEKLENNMNDAKCKDDAIHSLSDIIYIHSIQEQDIIVLIEKDMSAIINITSESSSLSGEECSLITIDNSTLGISDDHLRFEVMDSPYNSPYILLAPPPSPEISFAL